MKKLNIELFNSDNECVAKLICSQLDSCNSHTILIESDARTNKFKEFHFLAESLDHFNIFAGMVTLYYTGGHYMEVTRC